jgi:D-xylose transport system permease protein
MAAPEGPTGSALDDLDQPLAEAANAAALAAAPELVAQTFGEYLLAWTLRIRSGDAGSLPVVGGLIVISVLFQSLNSNFLTAGNLVNLLIQGAVYMLLAMAEVFVLLLGEIDLSAGYVAGLSAVVMAELIKQGTGWPWPLAIAVALLCAAGIGTLHGTLITRIGLPSFVVTLAGLLGWQGVMLLVLGQGGVVPINSPTVNNFTSGQLSVTASWITMAAVVGVYGLRAWLRDARRRSSGLVAPPPSVTALRIASVAVVGVVVVLICNANRGVITPIRGLPWVVLIVLGVWALWTFLLGRTKFGRYVYAIGGNPEAARRAGVNLAMIRTACFTLASFTAGIAGMIYASRLRSVSTSIDGGTLVLYAVAAAVIGGTSLFGGRGKATHAVLGGLVIAAIDNGMGLQGYSAYVRYIVTALVLLAAVTIDALTRRGRTAR